MEGQTVEYGAALSRTWRAFNIPPCSCMTGRYLGTKRTVVVPFTAHLAPSDSDAPNCNYVVNGTFKAISITNTRIRYEPCSDPALEQCASTDSPPPPPPPSPDPPSPSRPGQTTSQGLTEAGDDDDDSVNIGAVVGGVVGGLAVVLAFIVALVYVIKKMPILAIKKRAAPTPQATPVHLPAVGVKVRAANDKSDRDSGGPSIRV